MPHSNGGRGNCFHTSHSFEDAYEFVTVKHEFIFQSTTNQKLIAKPGKTKDGDPTIAFKGHGNVCKECWGFRKNCSNARIGHCVEALDKKIP